MVFDALDLWIDPLPRSGPEAMAVDEWLLESAQRPVLRVYEWDGAWGSVGYFGDVTDAMARIPGRRWVRRWTGGGTVDHADDWTYSVIVPGAHPFARIRSSESYRILHDALAKVLEAEGAMVVLAEGGACCGTTLCFEAAVSFDVVDQTGGKVAGAGQRRTRHGLLHQGSVAVACAFDASCRRARALAAMLCPDPRTVKWAVPMDGITPIVDRRYGDPDWLARRRGRA